MTNKKIESALILLQDKDGLESIIKILHEKGITIYSAGSTKKFIDNMNIPVVSVEAITSHPPMLEGMVKMFHPAVLGGILFDRDKQQHLIDVNNFKIPPIDLVIIDLPSSRQEGMSNQTIIEKMDIERVCLAQAAIKNFKNVVIISLPQQYKTLEENLVGDVISNFEERKFLAGVALTKIADYYKTLALNFLDS